MSSPRRRRRWFRVVLLPLLGLVLAEVAARLVYPRVHLATQWQYHPVLGWSQVPGGAFRYEIEGELVRVRFNDDGFRDVPHAVEKPDGVRRVVLIGDSFSESLQVNLDQTFFRILEQMLNGSGSGAWEVINLGVGDFGTAQAWLALEEYGWRHAPDVVLCQIFPLNDVFNNSLELFGLSGSANDAYRPYVLPSDDAPRVTSAQPFRNFLRRTLSSYTAAEWFLAQAIAPDEREREEARRECARQLGLPDINPVLLTFGSDAWRPPVVTRAWRTTEQLLEQIVMDCRARGAAVLPLVIPWDRRVGRAWRQQLSWMPAGTELVGDLPEQRLGALFGRLEVPAVMMRPVFTQRQDEFFPARAGHLNPAAHRMTAETIFATMRDHGMLD